MDRLKDTNTVEGEVKMFSIRQKREISDKVQQILRETNHPELPKGNIKFTLNVQGKEAWSWAEIHDNASVVNPEERANQWNEEQDQGK